MIDFFKVLKIGVRFSDDLYIRPKFLTAQPFFQVWKQKIVAED